MRPPVPIASVTVLNPELPKDLADDKGALLDVLVRLGDGRQVDVEMQSCSRPGLWQRALFYWARMYAAQIGRGQTHTELEPCVGIFLLDFNELRGAGFHSKFRVIEVSTHEPFSDALELHVVELPKLAGCEIGSEPDLVSWGRFFAAESDEELEELAMQDPVMRKAKQALEDLSADPSVQELARQRELAMIGYQLDIAAARKQGITEGLAEGRTSGLRDGEAVGEQRGQTRGRSEGLAEGRGMALCEAVLRLCAVFGVELDESQRQRLRQMSDAERLVLLETIAKERRFPA
jgi:predicted transposase/invertase (TIGR01784 family)